MQKVPLEPVDADHLTICKPGSRNELIDASVLRRLVADLRFPPVGPDGLVPKTGITDFVKELGPLDKNENVTEEPLLVTRFVGEAKATSTAYMIGGNDSAAALYYG
jgi:hypothetical protein